MWKDIDICYICLHTDRKLKIVDRELSSFHRELCDISIEDPRYCYECEYNLKKMIKFKNKCLKAIHILQNWIKTQAIERNPITTLCTLIPTTLGHQSTKNPCVRTYIHIDNTQMDGDNIQKYNTNTQTHKQTEEIPLIYVESEDNLDVVERNNAQNILETPEMEDKIKLEATDDINKVTVNDILVLKSETTGFEEILLDNNAVIDDVKVYEINDDLSDDLETKEIVVSEIQEKVVDKYSDTESNDSDTLYSIMQSVKRRNSKENKMKSTRKRSFDNLDKSISHSDKESDRQLNKRRKGLVKKEKDVNELKKKEDVRKKLVRKENSIKKSRFHIRSKGLLTEMTNGFDIENRKTLKSGGLKKAYSKERLIKDIESKFSSCGVLVSSDGTTIDKEFVLKCLHDKATEFVMKQLYKAVYRKSHFKPKALNLFKSIQNKYKNDYQSVFDIEYLNTKEKIFEEFEKRRTYESYVNSEFRCQICYQGFKHEKKLLNHNKCHDKTAGEIECPICKVRFTRRKALINHQNSHEAVYKCKLCPLVTYYRSSMINHFHLHKGMKYKCDQCNATFGSVSAQRTHVSYRHARAHACAACGRAYSTRMGLRAHHTRYHANDTATTDSTTGVKCEECSLTLASWEAYNRHLRFTHKQKRQIGRPPGSSSSYGARRASILPRKRPVMTCRVCDAVGDSVGWLQLHFTEQHPSVDMTSLYADKHPHLCDICGKSFCTIYSLQAHLNIHSGVRPYACEVCSARFHRAMSLQMHRLVHEPPSKPCTRCGKKFKTASNLNNHMRSHIGNRRYKCNICGKGFIHRNSVNEHIRGVHNNIRRVRKRVPDTGKDERGGNTV